jgi:cytochrome b involved in lipid metabolism
LIEEAGRDSTEAFEDVGHSDEARAMLDKMLLGDFHGEVCPFLLLSVDLSPGQKHPVESYCFERPVASSS